MSRCGIVDMGSNTVRLSIYRYDQRAGRRLMDRKEMVGLANYIKDGAMTREGTQAACRALGSFQRLMENLEIGRLYVFATAPLRNISNTAQVLEQIHQATGLGVDVLSGEEEARLSFQGALEGMALTDGILADLGGGSTEIVSFREGRYGSSFTMPAGSLSLFTRHVEGLFPNKAERRAIRAEIDGLLARQGDAFPQAADICGVGGTVRAACKLANRLYDRPEDCRTLTAAELEDIYDRLKKPGQATLRLMLKAAPDRLHTMIPGLMMLRAVAGASGCQSIQVSRCGVREGYLREKVMSGREERHGS